MDIGLEVIPEIGIPLPIPKKYSYSDLRKRVEAACNSAALLATQGATYEKPSRADKKAAKELVTEYAQDEKKASAAYTNNKLARMTPEAIIYAKSILDEYGHKVAENATQIRHLVTTKLIQESENADPRIRMKALELLGKISDVGLFSEKTEVTVTHQTSDELKQKLKQKLEKLINPAPASNGSGAKKLTAQDVEVDDELNALTGEDVPEFIDGDFEEINSAEAALKEKVHET